MFTKMAKDDTKKIFSGYGFRFDSDTEDENEAITEYINRCKKTFIKKENEKGKSCKKIIKRTNITSNNKSLSHSIITDTITFTKKL